MRQRTGRLLGMGLSFLLVAALCAGLVVAAAGASAANVTFVKDPENESATKSGKKVLYFDLAAGSVYINKGDITGHVKVNGNDAWASYTFNTKDPNDKLENYIIYIYQSTEENASKTGYKQAPSGPNRSGCQVPIYPRVKLNGELWTKYITNNADVYKVSENWAGAAENSDRGPTGNRIIFQNNSNYTANVIIDNIWSNYHIAHEKTQDGAIIADLEGL